MPRLYTQFGFWESRILIAGIATIAIAVAGFLSIQIFLPKTPQQILQDYAEQYVELASSLANHHEKEVDVYFGPPGFDRRDGSGPADLAITATELSSLLAEVELLDAPELAERKLIIQSKLNHLEGLITSLVAENKRSFAEELRLLYGIELETSDIDLTNELQALEDLLPGRGTLPFKVAAFRNRLVIPADKRKAVFEAALAECRTRTMVHWTLPASEELTIEWSRDVPAAWHQYLGDSRSILTVNDLSVAFIDSAVDIACHEGYPGHHAQYTLLEQQLADNNNPIEQTLVLLRSPESILLEGAANFGADLAFTAQERMEFERDVLAPIAGISLPDEEQYLAFGELMDGFSSAITPIVREYYDGEIAFNSATFRLEREAMVSSASALLEYVDSFGTYLIGYSHAEEVIEQIISTQAQQDKDAAWQILRDLVSDPSSASAQIL